jgi:FMN phosphatase YigB (HAD superfamily)
MKNSEYVLFLDLDGVLVDYSSGWWVMCKQLGIKKVKDKDFSEEELIQISHHIKSPAFWSSLGWEYGGEALWEAANELFDNIHILTSTAAKADNDYHKIVSQGKVEWIVDHLEGMSPSNIHIVTEGLRKANFATKNSILVDDRRSTIEEFNTAGGFGILHNSKQYKKTIYDLVEIAAPVNLGEMAKRLPIVSRSFWNVK